MSLLLAGWLTGCEQGFDPLLDAPSNLSIYGVLDATADTQWIRVMPIRESVFGSPDPIDVEVRLENVETGRVIEFRDSLFVYPSETPDVIDTFYAHNFWTTEPIEPGARYRFLATDSKGGKATAELTIPTEILSVTVGVRVSVGGFDWVRVNGVDHLPFLSVRHHASTPTGYQPFVDGQPTEAARREAPRTLRVEGVKRDLVAPANQCQSVSGFVCDIVATATATPWPFNPLYDDQLVNVPELYANIDGAIGFIGAVVRRTVPFEICYRNPVPVTPVQYCELVYDEHTATLTGRVMDFHCGRKSVLPAVVELWQEGNPDRRRMGTYHTDSHYTISGLRPGILYRFTVHVPGLPADNYPFLPLEGSVTLDPGERREMDLNLLRKNARCP